jgi:hypothetical protein
MLMVGTSLNIADGSGVIANRYTYKGMEMESEQ